VLPSARARPVHSYIMLRAALTAPFRPHIRARQKLSHVSAKVRPPHSLDNLLTCLGGMLQGDRCFNEHDVHGVQQTISRWLPSRHEYAPFVSWSDDPSRYTRNVIFSSPSMEVLLMCWPQNSRSTIHCHDRSSCWVVAVEGEVTEVQFEEVGPEALREINVTRMGRELGGPIQTYANNDIGVHRMENRSGAPAITMHVYAPRLQQMRTFDEASGEAQINTATRDKM